MYINLINGAGEKRKYEVIGFHEEVKDQRHSFEFTMPNTYLVDNNLTLEDLKTEMDTFNIQGVEVYGDDGVLMFTVSKVPEYVFATRTTDMDLNLKLYCKLIF